MGRRGEVFAKAEIVRIVRGFFRSFVAEKAKFFLEQRFVVEVFLEVVEGQGRRIQVGGEGRVGRRE